MKQTLKFKKYKKFPDKYVSWVIEPNGETVIVIANMKLKEDVFYECELVPMVTGKGYIVETIIPVYVKIQLSVKDNIILAKIDDNEIEFDMNNYFTIQSFMNMCYLIATSNKKNINTNEIKRFISGEYSKFQKKAKNKNDKFLTRMGQNLYRIFSRKSIRQKRDKNG